MLTAMRNPLSFAAWQHAWIKAYQSRGGMAVLIAQLIGMLILGLWLAPSGIHPEVPEVWHLMTASSALGVVLVGASVLSSRPRVHRLAPDFFWALVGVSVCLLVANVYVNLTFPLAQLPAQAEHQLGRPMALQTAIALGLLLSVAILMRWQQYPSLRDIGLALAFMQCLLLTNGYFAGSLPVLGQTDLIKTSPHTLAALWLLWFGAVGQRMPGWRWPLDQRHLLPAQARTRWEALLRAIKDRF